MRFSIALLMLTACCTGRRETSTPPTAEPVVASSTPSPQNPATDEQATRAVPATARYTAAHGTDEGVYDELSSQVELHGASWVDRSAGLVIANRHGDGFLFVAGVPVAFVGDAKPDIVVDDFDGADVDGDGFPDQLDILIGAKKAAVNNAPYGSPYREIDYPGGDVPRTEGVCTDVVVRAVRNAGLDLQKTLFEDIQRTPGAFRMVKKPNPNIDHRRVKTLLPHFERQWEQLPISDAFEPWLPGDVIFMQTMGDARPDHLGIVTDELGVSGAPLLINNWTDGFATSAMDVSRLVPTTHRFRMRAPLSLPAPHGGLDGLLHRHGLEVPADSRQAIVVTGHGWASVGAVVRRFERRDERWVQVGEAIHATLGANGLGKGRGLHEDVVTAPAEKREGDRRAPAGVFDLGTAFGRTSKPYKGAWPYRRVGADDRFVDDPESPHYNSWQKSDGTDDWSSAERLDQYVLGLVVEHNMPPSPGAGSAIFMHTWQGEPAATLGCTAMERANLGALLGWLNPEARPVLVQVAGQVFEVRE